MAPVIDVAHLSKRYGDTLAVDDLSFQVQPGSVTGFLGPNGAGKSTTMRMIVGLDAPSSGTRDRQRPSLPRLRGAAVRGRHDARGARDPHRAARRTTTCSRWRRPTASRTGRVDEVIERVGLQSVARKRVGSFSLGMGQRLGIAAALLGDPPTLILDEPANGLDPEGILWIRNLLKGLAARGTHGVPVLAPDERDRADRRPRRSSIGRGRLIADASVAGRRRAGVD